MAQNDTARQRKERLETILDLVGPEEFKAKRARFEQADAVQEGAGFVRQMRKRAGLSQTQLAERIGVKQARISEIEKGNTTEGISYSLLRRIAQACGFENWPPSPIEDAAEQTSTADAAFAYPTVEEFLLNLPRMRDDLVQLHFVTAAGTPVVGATPIVEFVKLAPDEIAAARGKGLDFYRADIMFNRRFFNSKKISSMKFSLNTEDRASLVKSCLRPGPHPGKAKP